MRSQSASRQCSTNDSVTVTIVVTVVVLIVCLKTTIGVMSITVRRLKSVPLSGRRPSDDGHRNDLHTASNKPESVSKPSGLHADNLGPDGELVSCILS